MFWESLQFSLSVTLPTILMMSLGIFLRYRKFIDDHFCNQASRFVFNFTLPPMLFLNMVNNPSDYASHVDLILSGLLCTLLLYVGGELFASRFIQARHYRGIFVQAIFRSNSAILGLALAINAYGEMAAAPTSVYTACLVLIFNTLGVITLSRSLSERKLSVIGLTKSVVKNPLILATLLGMAFSQFNWQLPNTIMKTGTYLANITLPLALICTGANLNFKQLCQFKHAQENADTAHQEASKIVLWGVFARLVVAPMVSILVGKFVFGLDPMSLGILFLTASAPVAAATYAMVRYYGGDATAAANLIGVSTIGSMIVSSLGLFVLRQIGWV